MLKFKLSSRVRKKRDLGDFERGLVVGAGPVVNLLGFPRTIISRVWSVSGKISSEAVVWTKRPC